MGVVEYPDDFYPILGDDLALDTPLHVEGFRMCHEVDDHGTCWCEPEIIGYDHYTDSYFYKHRNLQ